MARSKIPSRSGGSTWAGESNPAIALVIMCSRLGCLFLRLLCYVRNLSLYGAEEKVNCMGRNRRLRALDFIAAHLVCVTIIGIPCTSNAQSPADDVAAQVRRQGYQCNKPITATRDIGLSKPDSAVWILDCRNGRYRVRLDPDMAARITRLKKGSD